MKKFAALILALGLGLPAFAGDKQPVPMTQTAEVEKTPIDLVTTETGYVFGSDLNHGGSFGSQAEIQNSIEYDHRFLISGNWYALAGVAYNRFDFSETSAPVPVHLQSFAGVVGIEYLRGADVGAFLLVRPGFYTEDNLGINSFDAPFYVGRFFTIQQDKFYVLVGATGAFLRGGYPVFPLAGVIYHFNDKLELMGVLPEPRLIYSPTKQLSAWIGGELVGGSFRTDHHDDYLGIPHVGKLSNAQLDFYDYRAGVGVTYAVCKNIDLDFGGGASIERQFSYHRAGENFRTDPSPYVRLEIKAHF